MAHILQSSEWGEFKTKMGTTAILAGGVQYTKHKIPLSSYYYGYAPKANPLSVNWRELKKSLEENDCVALNFDIPNILKNSPELEKALEIFEKNNCRKSQRDTFAKSNVILDISPSEEELLANMHKKLRYNIRYGEKKGVTVYKAETDNDYEIFFKLLSETADRQKYYNHLNQYYKTVWKMFKEKGMAEILIAKYQDEPLAAWMLFFKGNVMYYPYGASSNKHRNLQASSYISWEAIKLGKEKGCKIFDMWGAADDLENKTDSYSGFTIFKMRYGGKHVTHMDSYDFVVNDAMYSLFTAANEWRWKLLNLIK